MRIIISLHIQPKILRKSHVCMIFYRKIDFANFHVYFQGIKISEGALTLWRHSDVIWSSMILILYQWIEEVHTYTLVVKIGVSSVPYRKSREGVATTPLRRTCYKNTSGGRGLRKMLYQYRVSQDDKIYCFSLTFKVIWFDFYEVWSVLIVNELYQNNIRYRRMCRSNGSLFHKKSINMGPFFTKNIP